MAMDSLVTTAEQATSLSTSNSEATPAESIPDGTRSTTSLTDEPDPNRSTVQPGDDPEGPRDGGDKSVDDEGKQTTESKKNSASSATMYCGPSGLSHVGLTEFGIFTCPVCQDDLFPPTARARLNPDKLNALDEDELDKNPNLAVSHSIEYRDSGGYLIDNEPWHEPFNLTTARKGVNSADRYVFEVVTVLGTSIHKDSNRPDWRVDEIMRKGIMRNPRVKVSVRTNRLIVHSPDLIRTIRNVVEYSPENLEADTLTLDAPYMLIAHHLEELESYLESNRNDSVSSEAAVQTSDQVGAQQLEMLLDYFKASVLGDIVEENARHAQKICTFGMLWLLYKPGSTVYFESDGQLSAYVVQSLSTDELAASAPGQLKEYAVNLWSLEFDGRFVGRSARRVFIPHFDGERKITSLKLFPCEFVDREDGGKTRRQLEEQGKLWYELLRGEQVQYSGRLLDPGKREFNGRVYVDPSSYYAQEDVDIPEICDIGDMGEELAKCQCDECWGRRPHPPTGFRWARYDLIDPNVEKDLELKDEKDPMHRYILCQRDTFGFDLKSRKWVTLDIANCAKPQMNSGAIDTLVMPEERKDMIKALIQNFTNANSVKGVAGAWRADFIESKGEGRIFLLHGSPGVGKTYTAECIAEYTGRPMMSLTCGDVGTDEVNMEKQLMKWFKLAEKWDAVMLIDEADVFLEKRQVTDLKRNSLVSVFLRCIEYYRGVLFLTTNRVGHFDDAFISRIHVIIYYDKLGFDERKRIWTQFFDKLSDERDDFVITGRAKSYVLEDDIMSKVEWNGREIRNAFQTAVALAEFRHTQKPNSSKHNGPTLDQRDFEQVGSMMRQFKTYLVDVHGYDEDGRAFQIGARTHNHN